MALSLGVRAGSKIRVADTLLEVLEVKSEDSIRIRINNQEFHVTDMERQQIMPHVYVSCGSKKGSCLPEHGRLAIEAPRSIPIIRTDAKHVRD